MSVEEFQHENALNSKLPDTTVAILSIRCASMSTTATATQAELDSCAVASAPTPAVHQSTLFAGR